VYIAIDCATTQLYVPGLKLHIRNAVKLDATPEEVMEGFDLPSLMGSAERDCWGQGAGWRDEEKMMVGPKRKTGEARSL
jgi:hypothetical protein